MIERTTSWPRSSMTSPRCAEPRSWSKAKPYRPRIRVSSEALSLSSPPSRSTPCTRSGSARRVGGATMVRANSTTVAVAAAPPRTLPNPTPKPPPPTAGAGDPGQFLPRQLPALTQRVWTCDRGDLVRRAATITTPRDSSLQVVTQSAVPVLREFELAKASLRSAQARHDIVISDIPAPRKLAPYATAVSANIDNPDLGSRAGFGTGRLVLLCDPSMPETWHGLFRIICFAQAPLDTDMGADPFITRVAWSWLIDSLTEHGATFHSASGTAAKTLSTGFGELAHEGDGAKIELRASWTPSDSTIAPHLEGWADLLGLIAGLPPCELNGVSALTLRRQPH